jgi:GH25 family lysozyme M1 (1,4-beta-N-acetylmuramidase)
MFTVSLPHVTGRYRGKHAKRAGVAGGAVIIIAGLAVAVGLTASSGGPASAAALPNSCSASTSSSSAADASAALDARAADLSPAALRARSAAVRADTVTPPPGDAQGIDISDLNFPSAGTGAESTEPDWSTLKSSGVSFVAIKATEGDYYTAEPPYTDNSAFVGYQAATKAATAAGLSVMPYAFGNPHTGNGTPQCQADYAWQEISSASPAYGSSSLMLPVALDIEPDPYATVQSYTPTSGQVDLCYNQTTSGMVTWISQFLAEMQKDSGKTPVIYTDPSFWSWCTGGSQSSPGSTAFSSYPLWLASWDVPSPSALADWSGPALWQYTDDETVDGMSGGVDGDYLVTQASLVGAAVTPFQFTTFPALTDGATATFSATGLPPGLSVDSSSGVISGTPTAAGSFTVVVTRTVSDGTSSTASLIWTVTDPITFPAQASRASSLGSPVSVQLSVTDTNSGQSGYTAPAFTATGLPSGLSISSTGLISGWPSTAGTYSVRVTAKDGLGATSTAAFTWTVKADPDTGTTGAIHQQGGSNKCLDDPSSKTTSGTAIDLATCTGKSNQSWTLVEDRSIRVLGHCLAASGTHALLYSCNGSNADQWLVGTDGSLVSVRYPGDCLNGPSGSAANGTKPTIAACTNTTSKVNQHWTGPIAPISAGVPGMCMFRSGSTAEIGTCGNYAVQYWDVASNAEIAVQSSYCLTEGGTTAGSAVTVAKCANAASQHWTLAAAGPIAEEIKSAASGLCVTEPSGATANGTHLVLGTCSTALNATWRVG